MQLAGSAAYDLKHTTDSHACCRFIDVGRDNSLEAVVMYDILWCAGMVWYGHMVWYGMVWCGIVFACDMIWTYNRSTVTVVSRRGA